MANTIVTNTIICDLCGGAGHITSDCKMKKEEIHNEDRPRTWHEREKMDSEYMSLMAELGQGEKPDARLVANGQCIINRNVLSIQISLSNTFLGDFTLIYPILPKFIKNYHIFVKYFLIHTPVCNIYNMYNILYYVLHYELLYKSPVGLGSS